MKVTLFTSNNHRHNYLINLLSNICDELWVVQECKALFTVKIDDKHQNKNIIGLHSHSHPTQMGNLSYTQQYNEYNKTVDVFKTFIGKANINSMSHPNGNYNNDTLKILRELDISIGFRANMNLDGNMTKINNSSLELARENHSNIMSYMSE